MKKLTQRKRTFDEGEDKGRSESGSANAADPVENNVQGEKTDNIVKDYASIVGACMNIEEDFQNTAEVDELKKENHFMYKDGHSGDNNICVNTVDK